MENIIEIKNLHYFYEDGLPALDGVNMAIKKGSITAVLGGNGAGKSTLFLNMNGVLKAASGQVIFKGVAVGYDKKSLKNLRAKVGVVFQDPNDQLFSSDVRADVSFGAFNLGLNATEVEKRVNAAMEAVGIDDCANKPVHALSFGQKKRAAIAGVLAMEPEVIILDEPTAGLDPSGVVEIFRLLMKIKEERGVTLIIATHEIDIVPLYCDSVYVMEKGRVVMNGTPAEIFAEADQLRVHSLRLPRISHLMEILSKKDGLDVNSKAATISAARKTIKELATKEGGRN